MFNTALVAPDLPPAEQPIVDCLPELQRRGVRRVILIQVIRVGYMQGAALAFLIMNRDGKVEKVT